MHNLNGLVKTGCIMTHRSAALSYRVIGSPLLLLAHWPPNVAHKSLPLIGPANFVAECILHFRWSVQTGHGKNECLKQLISSPNLRTAGDPRRVTGKEGPDDTCAAARVTRTSSKIRLKSGCGARHIVR